MPKTMSWSEIISNSKIIKKNVEEKKKIPTIKGYSKAEIAYILGVSVLNPRKPVQQLKATNESKSYNTNIYRNLKKDEYLDLAKRLTRFIKEKGYAPNFITFGNERISVKLCIYCFSKIIVYYNSHKQTYPNTCWFAENVFSNNPINPNGVLKKLENICGHTLKNYTDVYNVFRDYFSYDYYYEDKQTADYTINRRKGNCVDLNQVEYAVLVELYGKDNVQIVRGVVQCTDGQYGHVWCRVRNGGGWLNVDASAGARMRPLGSVICSGGVVSVTDVNPVWAVNDTGDA